MNRKIKTALLAVAFALFILAALFAYNKLGQGITPAGGESPGGAEEAAEEQEEEKPKIEAPDFTVEDAEGNAVKLSDFFGKPIVLNFWATWCPGCVSEMPEFNAVYEELGGEVNFLMVDVVDGQRETKETGARYIADQGYAFPVYFDTEQEAALAYGVMFFPSTIFIDQDGYVVKGVQGPLTEASLREAIALMQ